MQLPTRHGVVRAGLPHQDAGFTLLHQGRGGFEPGHFAGFEAQVGRPQKLRVQAVLPAQGAQSMAGVHGLLVGQAHLPA